MSVVESIEREIAALGEKAEGSPLAETALALARGLDADNSLTSKSIAAKALVDVLRELRQIAPPKKEKDGVDDLTARREGRRTRGAAAPAAART